MKTDTRKKGLEVTIAAEMTWCVAADTTFLRHTIVRRHQTVDGDESNA
jgi:hypothetical protein